MDTMIYINTVAASTASSSIIPLTITPSPRLEQITELTVIYPDAGSYGMDVYRASGTKPGSFSLDRHRLQGGDWRAIAKVDRKYGRHELPWPPAASVITEIKGVRVWTRDPMDKAQTQEFEKLLPRSSTPKPRKATRPPKGSKARKQKP